MLDTLYQKNNYLKQSTESQSQVSLLKTGISAV